MKIYLYWKVISMSTTSHCAKDNVIKMEIENINWCENGSLYLAIFLYFRIGCSQLLRKSKIVFLIYHGYEY